MQLAAAKDPEAAFFKRLEGLQPCEVSELKAGTHIFAVYGLHDFSFSLHKSHLVHARCRLLAQPPPSCFGLDPGWSQKACRMTLVLDNKWVSLPIGQTGWSDMHSCQFRSIFRSGLLFAPIVEHFGILFNSGIPF